MDKQNMDKILREMEAGYNLISSKFSETRSRFWRGLEFIGDYAKMGDKVLDFGCGNGRLLELFENKQIDYTGVDISQKLIKLARDRYPEKSASFQKLFDSGSLTFPENSFNTAYAIAVFHHLPSQELRFRMAKELYRVLQSEGIVVVTVWNLWQRKYIKNIFLNWLKKIIGQSKLDWNDCFISFKDNQGNSFSRYHHAFTKDELKNIFSKAGFKIEKCEIINNRNIVLIGRK